MGELDRAGVFKINLTKERDIMKTRIIIFKRWMGWFLVGFWFFVITLLFVLCLSNEDAHAQSYLTGKDLLEICTSKQESTQRECLGYIYGFVRGMAYQRSVTTTLLGNIQPKKPVEYFDWLKVYCLPGVVKMKKIESVVIIYLLNNPNELHVSSSELVLKSLIKAFPCK